MNEQEEQGNSSNEAGETLLEVYHHALQNGDAQSVEAAAMRFFVYACEQAGKEPDQNLMLKQEAHQHEDSGEWHKAETAYRQSLALAEAQNNPMQVYKAQDELSRLYSFLGKKERALEAAQAALEAARRSNIKPLLGMALEGLAFCWLRQENVSQSLLAANEMVQMLPAEKMYDLQRARALVLRARCYVELHQVTQAKQDLDIAWPLLTPLSGVALFAGIQSGLANWWEVTAQLRFLYADFDGAAVAWRKAVEHRRNVSQAPQLQGPYKYSSLAGSLRGLGQALLAIEDVKGSEQAFRESQAIQEAINQP